MSKSIFAIVAIAIVFYFWQLSRPDIITDESSYAVRAIRMVDFDFGIEQPTPWQWTGRLPPDTKLNWLGVPGWMRLSFHDHPPLVFLLQHYSQALFGENPFAIRLPSVLAGLAAVVFVFLIARRIYPSAESGRGSPAGGPPANFIALAAAGIFAFTANHAWISRIGLQESVLISLMLGSFYCFIRWLPPLQTHEPLVTDQEQAAHAQKNKKNFNNARWLVGASLLLGLAFLAKYIALILVPIFVSLLLWQKIKNKNQLPNYNFSGQARKSLGNFLLSIFLFLAAASPVIVYNIQLYRFFGHFDFQFSMLLNQNVPEWPERPGQESLGSLSNRTVHYVPWLIQANSPYFLLLALLGLVFAATDIKDRKRAYPHWPLALALFWTVPFLVFIGPAHRFLAILTPWLALAAAYGLTGLIEHVGLSRKPAYLILAGVLLMEGLYSFNSVIALNRIGNAPWTHAYIERQTGSWGFNELEKYLASELDQKRPQTPITFQFPFAESLIAEANAKETEQGIAPAPLAIVYNDNINLSAQLWIFLRRIVYEGWPIMSAENFRRRGGENFLREIGVKEIIFVNPTEHALQDRTLPPSPDGDVIEIQLRRKGAVPEEIKNPKGETAFHVYRMGL